MTTYSDLAFTPAVVELQHHKGHAQSKAGWPVFDGLTDDEIDHIHARDSFYLATVGETDWPYVQHRGGPAGFVTVVHPTTIGWIERTGNRQYIGTGNLTRNDRVAAIFMDYPNRARLKVYGRATYYADPPADVLQAVGGGDGVRSDGAVIVRIAATSWNCAKYITPRYTADEVRELNRALLDRIAELERISRPT